MLWKICSVMYLKHFKESLWKKDIATNEVSALETSTMVIEYKLQFNLSLNY